MNPIFSLSGRTSPWVYRILTIAFEDFSDSLDISLVTGLQELFLLFLLLAQVVIPDLIEHLLQLW